MRNVVSLELFEGFRFRNEGLVVCRHQYANDTLCMGKQRWKIFGLWKVC